MTKVTFTLATGWGVVYKTYSCKDNKTLLKAVDEYYEKVNDTKKGIYHIYVESAKMTFESGKTYTKRFN